MRLTYLLSSVERPTGGHAVIVDHVRTLRANGYDASVKFEGNSESYYRRMLPPDALVSGDPIADETCVLVLPEADLIRYATRVLRSRSHKLYRTLILNQNHFYTFNFGRDSASLRVFRSALHLATSKTIQTFLQSIMPGRVIPLIPVAIALNHFTPKQKVFRIAYMPRKMPDDAIAIRTIFNEIAPELRHIEWVAIENRSQEEVAAILNHSAIFLSLARREGFGMPAVEAMASGCVVVGFTGFGGNEYATPLNGFWVSDDDIVGVSQTLASVCRDFISDSPHLREVSKQASSDARVYSSDSMATSLIGAWNWIEDIMER